MSKFKVGDLVECRSDALISIEYGGFYTVTETSVDCICVNGFSHYYDNSFFDLVTENKPQPTKFNASGSKYLRDIKTTTDGKIDVYAVLIAFNVTSPARQHAIKKLLCAGIRGKNNELNDIEEARDAIERDIELLELNND